MKKYEWKYCGVCDVMTVICPECGNNLCNSGGNGCCEGAYEYMKQTEAPPKPENWKEIREKIQQSIKENFT